MSLLSQHAEVKNERISADITLDAFVTWRKATLCAMFLPSQKPMNYTRDISKFLCLLYEQAVLIHYGVTFMKIKMYGTMTENGALYRISVY
jgi:hypothetical protein